MARAPTLNLNPRGETPPNRLEPEAGHNTLDCGTHYIIQPVLNFWDPAVNGYDTMRACPAGMPPRIPPSSAGNWPSVSSPPDATRRPWMSCESSPPCRRRSLRPRRCAASAFRIWAACRRPGAYWIWP